MIYAIALMIAQACDPVLAALFTPPRPLVGRYEVCVEAEPIEKAVRSISGDATSSPDTRTHVGPIEDVEPLEAFGSAGQYDRAALARLYVGAHARVARGWIQYADRLESLTFISPYPDTTLTHLNAGTMVIRFTLRSIIR